MSDGYTKRDVVEARRVVQDWSIRLHEYEIARLARMIADERRRVLSGFVRHVRTQYGDQEYVRDVKRDVTAYRRRMR